MNQAIHTILADEPTLKRFGAALAAALRGHETLLLTGMLGSGKTTFARAVIQSLCGEKTKVASPTFMLLQEYDATAGFTIQHYDLYRLRQADELHEIGLEEAFGNVLMMVEWPEIASEYFPADAISLSFTPVEKVRELQVTATSTMVTIINAVMEKFMADEKHTRRRAMEAFVAQAGWENAEITFLAGDASFRRYERVFAAGRQAVLMDAPPEKEDTAPFIQVAKYLSERGFSAPKILAEDRENGFLLLEDLGDDSYTRLLAADASHEKDLYFAAIETLAALHKQPLALSVPPYDHATLMREISLFADWYLPAVMGCDAPSKGKEFTALWDTILQAHPPAQSALVLRDYHADNLLWLPRRMGTDRVGLLDFQDALVGHPAYDLVSLLEDARRDVSPATVDAALAHYLHLSGEDKTFFRAYYSLLGAQRNAKIIGIFVRLGVRDGKKHYTHYLPRVWAHFLKDLQHPWLAPIRDWVDANIKPEWRGAIML